MVVPIYTELDDAPALSDDWIVPYQARDTSLADREKSLKITYFAIDLNKAKARLDSAKVSVRDQNDRSAEASLVAMRSDLIAINHVADGPLLRARRDLALADQDITSKDMAAASRHLENATASLNAYSSVGHTAAARQLAADIRTAMPRPSDKVR